MDTKELIRRCKSITLKEEEEDAVLFIGRMKNEGERVAARCLVSKILLNRDVNKDGLRYAMQQAWKTTKEIKVESLGDNIFVFKFATEQDKKRVLTVGPWHFDKALIVLVEPVGMGSIKRQTFTHTSFWVQIHGMPIKCMVKETIEKLGEKIGLVEEVETDEEGECIGPFALVKISVDITKTLRRILILKQEGEEDIVMLIKYERLPDFCFCCGLIEHQFRECIKYKGQSKEKLIYNGWMKAPTPFELAKLNKGKNRKSKRDDQPDAATGNTGVQIQTQPKPKEQPSNPNLSKHDGSGVTQMYSPNEEMSVEMTCVAEVGEESLMKAAEELRQSYLEYGKPVVAAATIGEHHRTESKTDGDSSGKVKLDAVRSGERNMGLMAQQGKKENQTQGFSKGKEINFGPTKPKSQPKSRKWKTQARDSNLTTRMTSGPTSVKKERLMKVSQYSKWRIQQRRLGASLANSHETRKLERSGTGMSRGLAMIWNSKINVNITSYSSHHIDAIIQNNNGKRWRCIGIYGHPEAQQKRHTWTLMRRLAGLSPLPWLCIGDFNKIMHPNKKSSGNDRNVSMISEFREVAYECNLINVGYKGHPFTWSNRQFRSHHIEERLDRALYSKDWGNFFQEEAVTNMVMWESDHNLLVMNVQQKRSRVSYDRRTFFRVHYEDLWTPYEGCKNIMKEVWSGFGCRDDINPMQTFKSLSKATMAQLQWWSKEEFGERKERLKNLMEKLQCAVNNNLQYDNGAEIKSLER
ncbi:hypothetical protein KPL71_021472 [Citrus sinensis]|uniref:Uncharacterized protein n=1 Tax=Citrus sinensis TaxID=2711 RepID=A0ACB8JFH3_CITSI|nr:hypothetical protein KPL71_021472 [Citrus sinensis]